MSRSWAERWRIGLAPEGCEVLRLDWRGRGAQHWRLPCQPRPGEPAWRAAVQTLPQALEEAGARGAGAAVVLSNHFVRYLVLPWQPEISGARELAALARMRFQAVYGDAAAGWTVRCSEGGWRRTSVACAVDSELPAAVRAVLDTRALRLLALQPLLMAAFNDLRRGFADDAAFALVEPGRVCLGLLQAGAFDAIVSRRAAADAALAVEQELATLRPQAAAAPLELLRVGAAAPWPADGTRVVNERADRPLAAWGGVLMRALDLDLARRRARWPGWLAAAFGLLFAFDAGSGYLGLREQLKDLASERGARAVRTPPAEAMTEQTRREFEAARRLLLDLALPWERLFRSIESAVDKDTALLAVEPDAAKQTLQITGEARDYRAVLAFMARLERDRTLQRVHLLSHELREDAPDRPTQFTLAASWRAGS